MPFSHHMEANVLDYWFGDTSPTVPATYYLGLVLQCGVLSTALTAGTAYTSLACTANPAYSGSTNDVILLGTGSTTQSWAASGNWTTGSTSISVTSQIANATYAIGTPFIRCDAYATAQEPSGNAYTRTGTTAGGSITNNTTNFPNSTSAPPLYTKGNGVTFTFPQATGSWGTVAGWLLGDNATPGSGNIFAYGVLNAAQAISSGNTPAINSSAMTITLL